LAGGAFTAPVDGDAGGTWIAVRDAGVVLALLNHQPAKRAPSVDGGTDASRPARRPIDWSAAETPPPRTSRGLLVTALAAEPGIPDAARLRAAGLGSLAPFRLFIAGPSTPPRVLTWNGVSLTTRRLDPRRGFLTSSSWNPRAVIAVRQACFRAFARHHRQPSRADLVAFHGRTGHSRGTPWAICMAREDARTVSTTVVEAGPNGVSMRYRAR